MPGDHLPAARASVAGRRVFTANGVDFTVADLARRAGLGSREPLFGTAREAEESFRRSRGLLTADKLEAWLADWDVEPEDFRAWTEDAATGTSTATPWCTMLCSGAFEAATAQLISAVAAACELGAGPVDATTFDPAGWLEKLLASRITADAVLGVIAAHRLDWTRVAATVTTTFERGTVEELRHQVLHDGLPHQDAAARAGLPALTLDTTLADVDHPAVRAALSGARVGELVGPVPTSDAWTILSVTARTDPGPAEPSSLARAQSVVANEVIARAVARHVVA